MNESYSAWKEKRGRKSLWNILSDNDNIRKEKEKIVGTMPEKLEMTSN